MATPTRQFFSDGALCCTIWQSVVIHDVAGRLSAEHMRTMERAYVAALEANPRGAVGIAFLRAGTPVAPPDARAEGARFMKALGPRVPRVAMVIEESGVAGAALRSVIRGINVLARNQSLAVCANTADALQVIAPVLESLRDAPVDRDALASVVRQARATFRPASAALVR